MFDFQVETPILNSPFLEPQRHWRIEEGTSPKVEDARRKPVYFYRPPSYEVSKEGMEEDVGYEIELLLVSRIRTRLAEWKASGYPGASKITLELLAYWEREGREMRLFFAQREAAQTVIFLSEARADFLQGIQIPLDEPSDKQKAEGYRAFQRYACKMATGSGKTTVMGMLAAWSILNKIAGGHDRSRARQFSDTVLVVCPNVTIRNRLAELDPNLGEASLYRSRDLVPPHLMGPLSQGRVLVLNWHIFALQDANRVGGTAAKVVRTGRELNVLETVRIGDKTTTARGTRYLSLPDYQRQVAAGLLEVVNEETDDSGSLVKAQVASTRYVESDAAWLERVLGIKAGRRANVMVLNDEAHHAYRIRSEEPDEFEDADDESFDEDYYKEATIWVEGLDRIHKQIGINNCVDFSATPYFLGRVGEQANRPFPWVVSSFDLMEAIESGLTKIPQFAVRDMSGQSIPGYFNIWRWILPQLKSSERGGKKSAAKPEAILRYAYTPIVMLGQLWQNLAKEWKEIGTDPRPPVFIIVCKNTKLAKLVFEWLAEGSPPPGIPLSGLADFRNKDGVTNTIRVDSNVVSETDSGEAKSDLTAWMRMTLDTVGRLDWPRDCQGSPIYPEGFVVHAEKLGQPLHPPGRDVRAIVSVGMLTEGWDCNTVTHIVGLRPFMSQLLCEQVVGRGLRRASYEAEGDGDEERLGEEVAQVFGVPFQVVPFKANKGVPRPPVKTWRVRALPERADLEIRFPRVEGYMFEPSDTVEFDWDAIPQLVIDPTKIPPEVQMKAGLPTNEGRPTLYGPGKLDTASLAAYRAERRLQTRIAETARELVRVYIGQASETNGAVHPSRLYPQFVNAVTKFVKTKVKPHQPAMREDVFLAPYYGLMIEYLLTHQQLPKGHRERIRIEQHRGAGTTGDVEYVTRKEPVAVLRSHVNYVVPDSQWERIAAYALDNHPAVESFVKNSGLGFSIPYVHMGQGHDYLPDFIVKVAGKDSRFVILETKGMDDRLEEKRAAAERWVDAINADGRFGKWSYTLLQDRAGIAEEVNNRLTSLKDYA